MKKADLPAFDTTPLQALFSQLRIAHHIPGRIRLKLEATLTEAQQNAIAEAQRLLKSLDQTPGIRSASLNLLARSCTVEYDPKAIPPAAWRDLIDGGRSPEATALLDLLVGNYRRLAGV